MGKAVHKDKGFLKGVFTSITSIIISVSEVWALQYSHFYSPEGMYMWELSFAIKVTRSSGISVSEVSVRRLMYALLKKYELIKTLAFLLN